VHIVYSYIVLVVVKWTIDPFAQTSPGKHKDVCEYLETHCQVEGYLNYYQFYYCSVFARWLAFAAMISFSLFSLDLCVSVSPYLTVF